MTIDRSTQPEAGLPDRAGLPGRVSFRPEDMERKLAAARPLLKVLADELLGGDLERRVDASDLVQETLLKGAAQYQTFQGATDQEFFAWLNQILQNNLIDTVRHHTCQKRDVRRESVLHDSIPDGGESPSSIIRGREDQGRVTVALELLRPDQKEVLLLRNDGLTFEEIGRRIGKSADATRMLWGRSVLSLGKLLKTNDSTIDYR